jgi:hypothetical protein
MKDGQKELLKSAGSAVGGSVLGAAVYEAVGGLGVAVMGTATGVTLGPFVAIGAGIGLVGYGVFWLGKQTGIVQQRKKQLTETSRQRDLELIADQAGALNAEADDVLTYQERCGESQDHPDRCHNESARTESPQSSGADPSPSRSTAREK